MEINEDQLVRYFETARDSDVPKDQVKGFVEHGYIAYPWQLLFHAAAREADADNGPTQIGLGGARGPGKSHAVMAQVGIDDCLRVPNLKGLFLRQTGKAAKESFEDVIQKVLSLGVDYKITNNTLIFPNGSRVLLGGFYTERDIDKYVGIEYDFIAIEELNQLTQEKYTKLRGSLRTSKPNWRPRVYASFNPGGVGHGWIKETFIEPHRQHMERDTRFIPSTYRDNPNLNKEYVAYLEGLEGDLGKAWRDGEWDIFAGQFFQEWRSDVHVVDPFPIPDSWRIVLWGDYGFRAPSAVAWVAISPDKQKFVYRELYETGLTYTQLVEEIIARTPDSELERLHYAVFDPAIWQRKGENDGGLSGAEIMAARWAQVMKERNATRPLELPRLPTQITLKRGANDRHSGWMRFREALKPYLGPDGTPTAEIQYFSTCIEHIRSIPALVHDENKVEDLDTDMDDHCADANRYGLMDNAQPFENSSQLADRVFAEKMKAKKQQLRARKIQQSRFV